MTATKQHTDTAEADAQNHGLMPFNQPILSLRHSSTGTTASNRSFQDDSQTRHLAHEHASQAEDEVKLHHRNKNNKKNMEKL